jgi:nitroreductase
MEFAEVVRTTFACREFTDEPVPDEVIHRLLDQARFAPSGGNRQGWKVVVVKDRATRARLAELCEPTMAVYLAQVRAGEAPWNTIVPTSVDVEEAARHPSGFSLLSELADVPALLVVGVDLGVVASFDQKLDRIGVISGASVYPFVWNILLAARNAGLGGALTTFLAGEEPAAQAVLGFPAHVAVAAMIPLGHPRRQLTRLSRKPVEAFATIDRFDGPALGAPAGF